MGDQAEYMEQLTVGMIVEGKVKSLTKFGAFITLPDGSTGMVHISEVAHTYVNDIHDHLHEGDTVKVMETRPLSKDKRWRVVEIIEKAK